MWRGVCQADPPRSADAAWHTSVTLVGVIHRVNKTLSEREFRGPMAESLEGAEAGFIALVTHPDRTLLQLRSIPFESPLEGIVRQSLERVNR